MGECFRDMLADADAELTRCVSEMEERARKECLCPECGAGSAEIRWIKEDDSGRKQLWCACHLGHEWGATVRWTKEGS
jgi:hypothetical protein